MVIRFHDYVNVSAKAAPAVAAPAEGNYTNRHGEPCSKECGEGRHSECKQSMFDGCNCTYRGLHTVPHRYANIGDGIERASTPPPAATVKFYNAETGYVETENSAGADMAGPSDLEGKLRELADSLMLRSDAGSAKVHLEYLREATALGRAEGLGDSLKIVGEFTYLDGQAGELAHLIVKRIEAIRALKEKV